jgi:NAD(P)-dependent dehydrogenase (short-subunit alcohol dehydrogenase family)
MKVIVIGGTGTIGSAVVRLLSGKGHEVFQVGHTRGDYRVDLASPDTLRKLFQTIGTYDAVVCAAGLAKFAPFKNLTDADFHLGLLNKLMGQVNVVRTGLPKIAKGGSFTLTSGVLASEPMPGSTAISPANAGIEGFVRAAALELASEARVNVVSPPWVKETLVMLGMDSAGGLPAADVARAYAASVEGKMTGEVIDARKWGVGSGE